MSHSGSAIPWTNAVFSSRLTGGGGTSPVSAPGSGSLPSEPCRACLCRGRDRGHAMPRRYTAGRPARAAPRAVIRGGARASRASRPEGSRPTSLSDLRHSRNTRATAAGPASPAWTRISSCQRPRGRDRGRWPPSGRRAPSRRARDPHRPGVVEADVHGEPVSARRRSVTLSSKALHVLAALHELEGALQGLVEPLADLDPHPPVERLQQRVVGGDRLGRPPREASCRTIAARARRGARRRRKTSWRR